MITKLVRYSVGSAGIIILISAASMYKDFLQMFMVALFGAVLFSVALGDMK